MSPQVAFMSLGVSEIAVLAVVALLVFGGRLPDVMRKAGRSYARLRRSLDELANPLREEMRHMDVREAAKPFPRRTEKGPPLPERNPPSGVYDIGDEPDAPDAPEGRQGVVDPVPPREERDAHPGTNETTGSTRSTAADEPPPV